MDFEILRICMHVFWIRWIFTHTHSHTHTFTENCSIFLQFLTCKFFFCHIFHTKTKWKRKNLAYFGFWFSFFFLLFHGKFVLSSDTNWFFLDMCSFSSEFRIWYFQTSNTPNLDFCMHFFVQFFRFCVGIFTLHLLFS